MKCYVAGALTHSGGNRRILDLYERIGGICERHGFDVYLPHIAQEEAKDRRIATTPEMIFDWDFEQLKTASLIVAFVGMPSVGVGIELGLAKHLGIPIISLCPLGFGVSPMLLGHPCLHAHLFYQEEEDCIQQLSKSLNDLISCCGDSVFGNPALCQNSEKDNVVTQAD